MALVARAERTELERGPNAAYPFILAKLALQVLAEDDLALSADLLDECQRVLGYASQPRIHGFYTLTAAVRHHLSGRLEEEATTYRQGIEVLRGVNDHPRASDLQVDVDLERVGKDAV